MNPSSRDQEDLSKIIGTPHCRRGVRHGGAIATTIGFIAGAAVYVAANALLDRHGARHRKRSGDQQPSEDQQPGSGAAIAIGALLDGIPESVVLGLSLIGGGGVSPRDSRRDLQVPEPDYRC